jgi:tetraacyldisaccharide 4'-kinase
VSGPLPPALAPLTVPLAWLYGRGVAWRNRRWERGGVVRVDVPVISVGNLTAGGAGKTPMVAWLAARLRDEGRRPEIALRGYKSRGGTSDEAVEHAERLPGVAVLADPDRAAAIRRHLAGHGETDCAILDDGFQHRRLHRDLDLVLVDATAGTMRDRLLPRGWLREPLESLARADAVIVTRADEVEPALGREVERFHGRPPIAWCRHAWRRLLVHAGAAMRVEPPAWLAGRRIVALLGVARPEGILAQLRGAGAVIAAVEPARDHEHFSRRKLGRVRRAARSADAVVTTGKDWARIRNRIDSWPAPIVVPEVSIEMIAGEAELWGRVTRSIAREK